MDGVVPRGRPEAQPKSMPLRMGAALRWRKRSQCRMIGPRHWANGGCRWSGMRDWVEGGSDVAQGHDTGAKCVPRCTHARATDAGFGHQQAGPNPPYGRSDRIPGMWDNGSGIGVEIRWIGWNWELITENGGGTLIRKRCISGDAMEHPNILYEDPRTLMARGVVPYTPPLDCLVPYIREAGFGELVRDRDLGNGLGISGRASLGRRGEELCWGEDELAEGSSADDSGGRRPVGCPAPIIVGFYRSVLDIPAHVHREQARQLGDERLPTPCDIVDLPEIPPLLSTRQRPDGVSPCVSLNGLGQISRDTHAQRMLDFRNELDRVGVDDFVWTPYMAPHWRIIEPGWVNEVGEVETWLATVPIKVVKLVSSSKLVEPR
ncbi:hypothetical protein PIB30_071108 [Stylosanthes scabra]|uniref:Uncharacterized protein n=1 Tax=Stylosanthes scabra TaxID=79078 RepID=A0ABU6SQN9_9FABA|nr:hypothetical protein [Stylosanthes scabra]